MSDLALAFFTAATAAGIALLIGILMVAAKGIVKVVNDRAAMLAAVREALRLRRPSEPGALETGPQAALHQAASETIDTSILVSADEVKRRRWRNSGAAVFSICLLVVISATLLPTLSAPAPAPGPSTVARIRTLLSGDIVVADRVADSDAPVVAPEPTPSPTPSRIPTSQTAAAAVGQANRPQRPSPTPEATPEPTQRPAATSEPTPEPTPTPPPAEPPVITFWGARDPRFPGDDADFYGRCYQCDSWTIDFGDGQIAEGDRWIRAEHVYGAAGEYTATLTVRGPGGEVSEQTVVHVRYG
jgi:hypothetical protein